MKTILLIGDYFPNFSWESFWNKALAESLVEHGYQVVLLSKAWCEVDENNFVGSVDELSGNEPFTRRYFIDPIQMKRTRGDLINGFLGLVCKIISLEKIEGVLFSEQIEYAPLVELIKSRFDLPCYLSLYKYETISDYLLDNYISAYIRDTFSCFEKIFTLDPYINLLSLHVQRDKLVPALPFCIQNRVDGIPDGNSIFVVGVIRSAAEAEVLSTKLANSFSSVRQHFLMAGETVDKKKIAMGFENAESYVCVENLSDLSALPNGRAVFFADEVIGQMNLFQYYTALSYGITSIVENKNIDRLQNFLDVLSEPFISNHSQLLGFSVNGKVLADQL
jgi:hypothetical protein